MEIHKLIEFKNWADEVYIQYASNLSEEDFTKKILGKSIKDTMLHMYEVYYFWYIRMTTKDFSTLPDFDKLNSEEIFSGMKKINQKMLDYAHVRDISVPIHIKWDENDNEVITNPENIFFNAVNHSAYHRGQIAIKLRELGIPEIKETDYNPYIYELGQK